MSDPGVVGPHIADPAAFWAISVGVRYGVDKAALNSRAAGSRGPHSIQRPKGFGFGESGDDRNGYPGYSGFTELVRVGDLGHDACILV